MTVQIAVEYEGGQTIYLVNGTQFPPLRIVLLDMRDFTVPYFVGCLVEVWTREEGDVFIDVKPDPEADMTLYLDPARQWIGLSEHPGVVEWWLPLGDFQTKVYEPAVEAIGNAFHDKNFWGLLLQMGYEALGTVTE